MKDNDYTVVATTGDGLPEDSIVIQKKRYEELLESEEFLGCLQAAGVDNWEGYEQAQEILED